MSHDPQCAHCGERSYVEYCRSCMKEERLKLSSEEREHEVICWKQETEICDLKNTVTRLTRELETARKGKAG